MKTTTRKSAAGYVDVSVDSNGIVRLAMCERETRQELYATTMPIDGAKALVLRLIRTIDFFDASKDVEQRKAVPRTWLRSLAHRVGVWLVRWGNR